MNFPVSFTSIKFQMLFTKVEFFSRIRSMINQKLFRLKKYLASCVTAIVEGSVKKLRQCLTTTVTFVTIPRQLTTFHHFLNLGKTSLTRLFSCLNCEIVDKAQVKFVIAYQ